MWWNVFWQKMRVPVEIMFIYAWLVSLNGTNCFYSVYALCALLSIVTLISAKSEWMMLARWEVLWLLIGAAAFSLATMLGNIPLFFHTDSLRPRLRSWFAFVGGVFVAWNILTYLLKKVSSRMPADGATAESRNSPMCIFWVCFFAIAGLNAVYFATVAFPGVYSADCLSTFGQILSGNYNNTMPFWHTVTVGLIVKPVLALTGNINIAAACFISAQILFLAACMAYTIMTMYQAGVKWRYLLVVALIYMLAPYNIVYSVTLWKDVLFGAALLLMVTAMYRILVEMEGRSNYLIFTFGALGGCLWRTNGWYAFAVAALVMLFLLRKDRKLRKFVVLIVVVAVLTWFLLNPLLALLNVESTDMVEAFAVPFQQFARYVAEDGWMDEAERELLGMAFDLDRVKEVYDPLCVDPIKFQAFRRENLDYIRENLMDYVKLYIQFLVRRPDIYLQAWAEETKGFWCGGFSDPLYDMGVVENTIGLVQMAGDNPLGRAMVSFCDTLRYSTLLEPLYAIGLHVWTIFGCCLVNALRNRRLALLSIPFMVISVGLWFGSPVIAEFRYGYPMVLSAPFILAVTLCSEQTVLATDENKTKS